jgi:hypothetical protein
VQVNESTGQTLGSPRTDKTAEAGHCQDVFIYWLDLLVPVIRKRLLIAILPCSVAQAL